MALIAGFLCPDTWWYYLAPALAEHGYRVLLAHYRAHSAADLLPEVDAPTLLEYREQVNGYVLDFLAEYAGRQTSTSAGLKSIDE